MTAQEAYAAGFIKRCEEVQVSPEQLVKFAKMMQPAPTAKEKADFAAKAKQRKVEKKDPTTKLKSTGAGSGAANIKQKTNLMREMLAD